MLPDYAITLYLGTAQVSGIFLVASVILTTYLSPAHILGKTLETQVILEIVLKVTIFLNVA